MPSGSVTTLGLGTDLDLQSIIDGLREVDEASISKKEGEIESLQASQDEFNTLNATLLKMRSSTRTLTLSSNWLGRTSSVSSENISVNVEDGASLGSYSVNVDHLASYSSFISSGVENENSVVYYATSQSSAQGLDDTGSAIALAEGDELTINIGSTAFTITGGAGGFTLDDLVLAVNSAPENDDGLGTSLVTASTYADDDGKFHIEIAATSGESGKENEVSVSVATDPVNFVPADNGFADTDTAIALAEGDKMEVSIGSETFTITGGTGGYTLDELAAAINQANGNDDGDGGALVTASSYLDNGSYYLEVQDASGTSEVTLSVTPDTMDFSSNDTNTFTYQINGEEVSLTVDSGTTLKELAALINEDENNAGVTASVIDSGIGSKSTQLVLRAKESGEDNRISILSGLSDLTLTAQNGEGYTASSQNSIDFSTPVIIRPANNNTDIKFEETNADGETVSLKATIGDQIVYSSGDELAAAVEAALEDASSQGGNAADYTVTWNQTSQKLEISEAGTLDSINLLWSDAESTAAATLGFSTDQKLTPKDSSLNAAFSVDGISYQRQSNNNINDIITGASISLESTGSSDISITKNNDDLQQAIVDLVNAYAEIADEIDKNNDYDLKTGTFGTLYGYSSVNTMHSIMLDTLGTRLNFGGEINSLYDIGLDYNRGVLSINENTLSKAMDSQFDQVKALFLGTDTQDGLADLIYDYLGDLTGTGGLIDSETSAIDDKISVMEDTIESETERIEKKYDTMTAQFVELDSYMSEMENMLNYVDTMFSSLDGNKN